MSGSELTIRESLYAFIKELLETRDKTDREREMLLKLWFELDQFTDVR